MAHLAFFSGLGAVECVALVVLGVLLYGRNLPAVARTVGRTIGEFKRQLREVEDQIKREALHDEIRQMREMDPFKEKEAGSTDKPA
jgi:sec-independent protein translocase protein TatA